MDDGNRALRVADAPRQFAHPAQVFLKEWATDAGYTFVVGKANHSM
jgi:hypothetical protein